MDEMCSRVGRGALTVEFLRKLTFGQNLSDMGIKLTIGIFLELSGFASCSFVQIGIKIVVAGFK